LILTPVKLMVSPKTPAEPEWPDTVEQKKKAAIRAGYGKSE